PVSRHAGDRQPRPVQRAEHEYDPDGERSVRAHEQRVGCAHVDHQPANVEGQYHAGPSVEARARRTGLGGDSSPVLFLVFFLSGLSGLIYQVAWVRQFGIAFGSTIHTTSLVVALFMLGLGGGSYLAGLWADRRYARAPDSLLSAYGVFELLIA